MKSGLTVRDGLTCLKERDRARLRGKDPGQDKMKRKGKNIPVLLYRTKKGLASTQRDLTLLSSHRPI